MQGMIRRASSCLGGHGNNTSRHPHTEGSLCDEHLPKGTQRDLCHYCVLIGSYPPERGGRGGGQKNRPDSS